MISKLLLSSLIVSASAADGSSFLILSGEVPIPGTCGDLKAAYKGFGCCGNPNKVTNLQLVPMNPHKSVTPNPCDGKKPAAGAGFDNKPCFIDSVHNAIEQSGTNVTMGYQGGFASTSSGPIKTDYFHAGLCPVNVHWHVGTEHYSMGEYDEHGTGPAHPDVYVGDESGTRRLSSEADASGHHIARVGFRCHHLDLSDTKFTTPYKFQHCNNMYVGETYEVHWPHSAVGACNTPNQFQTPFYDGVFCNVQSLDDLAGVDTAKAIGVQAQVFIVVNDESYYYPDLMRGMIVDGKYGEDIARYTGSTTGTTRDNKVCSAYAPITWQVDRKCHMVSASSFDKMCADMKSQKDDLTPDMGPHGSRELVLHNLSADNQHK